MPLAVIYTRVSKDQHNGRSVEDQERECRAECDRRDWPVRAVFCDNSIGASRYSPDRPQWRKLKGALRKGDILVVWESSRSTRDLAEYVLLRDLCASLEVSLSYAGKVLDLNEGEDRFTGGLDVLLAEREAEVIRIRVLRGKRSAAEKGRPNGKPPWGYRRVEVGIWEPHEIEAPRVRESVARILAGDSMNSVLRFLRTSPGWMPNDITILRRAISNPALAGLRVHQGEVVGKGSWAEHALITERQHKQLLLRFGRAKAVKTFQSEPGPHPKYLLSSIATCGVCQQKLYHKGYKDRRKSIYTCRMGHVSRIVAELDKAVEDRLFGILRRVNPADYESDDPESQQLLAELKEAEDEAEAWLQSVETGEVSRVAYIRMEKILQGRIAGIKARLIGRPAETIDIAAIMKNWDTMKVRQKRAIIRAFFVITIPQIGKTPAGGRLKATRWDADIRRIGRT